MNAFLLLLFGRNANHRSDLTPNAQRLRGATIGEANCPSSTALFCRSKSVSSRRLPTYSLPTNLPPCLRPLLLLLPRFSVLEVTSHLINRMSFEP